MHKTYKIIFRGEILPGHNPDEVEQRLAVLFKITPEQARKLFSGRNIVLRKGISGTDLPRYQAALQRAGLQIHTEAENDLPSLFVPAEPEPTSPSPAAPANQPRTAAAAPQPAMPLVEEITCPNCGYVQPKRTLCLKCSADMPAYHKAQANMADEAVYRNEASVRYDRAPAPAHSLAPALFGFGFSGRWGRLTWLSADLLKLSLFLGLGALTLHLLTNSIEQAIAHRDISALTSATTGLALLLWLPTILLMLYWTFRDAALRCHDLGWSGLWSLLYCIPVFSLLFQAGLLLLPGERTENEYDAPPLQESWLIPIAAIAALVITASLAGIEMSKVERASTQRTQKTQAQDNVRHTGQNQVIMYSLTTCGYCDEKRTQLRMDGIAFTEYFLDQDQHQADLLWKKLQKSGYQGGIGTPTLEVNGVLLPNNPSLEEIKSHLN